MAVTIICTAINALQFRWSGWPATPGQSSLARQPSTYIGLDKLSPSSEESFRTFPILLTQIDSAAKSRVLKDDVKQRLTELGVVWPDTRRFLIYGSVRPFHSHLVYVGRLILPSLRSLP